ncbi:N-acyl-D-amino-acid deacylase family protein [Emergencia timonensis]|uniref:N-acyl-D-amino-acid deacylase family protein n=1 Tax=Emergencia timonensis TaxID=1776384 RepID=UPI0039946B06
MYDVLIKNGMVIDGTGAAAKPLDVACKDGRVYMLEPGSCFSARKIIDAAGLWVSPGFIDTHSHGDFPYGVSCNSLAKVSQGITTHLGGQCGLSAFPLCRERIEEVADAIGLSRYPERPLCEHTTFARYRDYMKTISAAEHIGFFLGHETLRQSAMGAVQRVPSQDEMNDMTEMLEEALLNGAFGMSTGLAYPPGAYAEKEELYQLCKVLKKHDGIYATHMRDEGRHIIDSVKEVIWLGKETGCRVHISHLKVCGLKNFGLSQEIFELLDQAERDGVRISVDAYPYTMSGTQLIFCLPPDLMEGGIDKALELIRTDKGRETARQRLLHDDSFDNIYQSCGSFEKMIVAACAVTKDAVGKSVAQWGRNHGYEAFEAFFALLLQNRGEVGAMFEEIGEEDMRRILQDSRVMIGSDGAIDKLSDGGHPRTFGTFPRAIALFTRDEKLVSLEEMIRRMTSLPAKTFQVEGKGILADGMDADITIFDPKEIRDQATILEPVKISKGIDTVLAGGKIVFRHGALTGETPGTVITKGKRSSQHE